MIYVLFILLIAAIGMAAYGFYTFNENTCVLGSMFIIIFSILIGGALRCSFYTKQIVKPEIEVTCVNGKCDTTYRYNFKNK